MIASIFEDEIISFEADEDTIDYFVNGQCNSLAYRIHKLTGWTLAMLIDTSLKQGDYLAHAFVIDSNGLAIDIEGRRSLEEFRKCWCSLPKLIRFFSLAEFEAEMSLWNNPIHYTRDHQAKIWAKKIVDILS